MNAASPATLAHALDNAGLEIATAGGGGVAIVAQSSCRHLPTVQRHPLLDTTYRTHRDAWAAVATRISD